MAAIRVMYSITVIPFLLISAGSDLQSERFNIGFIIHDHSAGDYTNERKVW